MCKAQCTQCFPGGVHHMHARARTHARARAHAHAHAHKVRAHAMRRKEIARLHGEAVAQASTIWLLEDVARLVEDRGAGWRISAQELLDAADRLARAVLAAQGPERFMKYVQMLTRIDAFCAGLEREAACTWGAGATGRCS